MPIYAGIGSRRTPPEVYRAIVWLARLMAARGWTLRTGGADGADTAFLSGCLLWEPRYELYLPWPAPRPQAPPTLTAPTEQALAIAARYHPAWPRLTERPRLLHGRNTHQILGADCRTPVDRVICWTPDGSLDGRGPDSGGTGQALRVAAGEAPHARVTNLARPEHWNAVADFIDPDGRSVTRR